jgi:hypothetical protein
MAGEKQLSPSKALAAEVIYTALTILRVNGKEMPMRDLMALVEKQADLDS